MNALMTGQILRQTKKLRKILNTRDIRWIDASDENITRTHFRYEDHKVSVIQGHGTYGGPELLEMMIDKHEPDGWLTADECFEILEKFDTFNEIGERIHYGCKQRTGK